MNHVIDLCSDNEDEPQRKRQRPSPPLLILQTCHGEQVQVTCEVMETLARSLAQPRRANHLVTGCGSLNNLSSMIHIQQKDRWSCGFRNLQMLLSALLPLLAADHAYFAALPSDSASGNVFDIPSLLALQQSLEASWRAGYDPQGAQHYRHRLAGTQQLIGAMEVATCLDYFGVDATVVQFIQCYESRRRLGGFCAAYLGKRSGCRMCGPVRSSRSLAEELLQPTAGVEQTPTCSCPVLPLYLQWKGHSVSLIGVETNADGLVRNLLVLDPMKDGSKLMQAAERNDWGPFRISCDRLHSNNTQVVLVTTRNRSAAEQSLTTTKVVTAAEDAVLRARRSGRYSLL